MKECVSARVVGVVGEDGEAVWDAVEVEDAGDGWQVGGWMAGAWWVHNKLRLQVCNLSIQEMLYKANTYSTREYDSFDSKEYPQQQSRTNQSQLRSRPPMPRGGFPATSRLELRPCLRNQTLSNILLLLSAPLLVVGYNYANYNKIQPAQTVFCKFLTSVSLLKNEHYPALSGGELKVLLLRAVFAAVHTFVIFTAQQYLPLTSVLTVNSSGIVFLYFGAHLVNKNRLSSVKSWGIIFCVGGLALTIASQTIWAGAGWSRVEGQMEYSELSLGEKAAVGGALVGWVGVSALSLLYGSVRSQGNLSQTIEIYSIVGLFLFSLVYQWMGLTRERLQFLRSTFVSGLILAASNYLFNWGLHLSRNKGLSSFLNQLTILASYLVSVCCLKEGLNWVQAAGSALMLASSYFILLKA